MKIFIWLLLIVIVIIIGALVLKPRPPIAPAVSQTAPEQTTQTPEQSTVQPQAPNQQEAITKNGMKIETTKQGSGEEIKTGQTAVVQYEGKLADGTVFDSTAKHGGEPFSFTLGTHQVIEGWEEGVLGMKVGETRVLTIPPELGYGAAGYPPVIPQNATLTFTVTLVGIK